MILDNNIPITELKLILDGNLTLHSGFSLNDDLLSYFDVKKPPEEMKIWYLDTPGQDLKKQGWIVRYRYHQDCDFELTYKKRYDEQSYNTLSWETYNAFKGFKSQIDMSVSKKTYSLSYVKLFKMNDGLYFLKTDEAKQLAESHSPSVFSDWNSEGEGLNKLKQSALYGPVEAREYKGKYAGVEATFEIWKLGGFINELSFKVDTARSEELLQNLLGDDKIKRLVDPEGTLKTEALFAYYSSHRELVPGSG